MEGKKEEKDKKKFEKLSKKSIEKLKEAIEGKELIDDDILEDKKKIREKIGTSIIAFSEIIIFCYDGMNNCVINAKIENEKLKKAISEYLQQIDVEKIRSLYSSYEGGRGLGDHYKKLNILEIINPEREKYENLVNTFFSVFGGEL